MHTAQRDIVMANVQRRYILCLDECTYRTSHHFDDLLVTSF